MYVIAKMKILRGTGIFFLLQEVEDKTELSETFYFQD